MRLFLSASMAVIAGQGIEAAGGDVQLVGGLSGRQRTAKGALSKRAAELPQFLRTLVHEELGLSEETFPSPWRSTLSATLSTAHPSGA